MNWDAVFEKALMPGFVPNVSGVPQQLGAKPVPAQPHEPGRHLLAIASGAPESLSDLTLMSKVHLLWASFGC